MSEQKRIGDSQLPGRFVSSQAVTLIFGHRNSAQEHGIARAHEPRIERNGILIGVPDNDNEAPRV